MSEQIVVIGAGPGGVEAAATAARAGRPVTLISDGPVGGRAGWHSLLPSKAWLAAAEEAQVTGRAPNFAALLERLEQIKRDWNGGLQSRLASLGVTILSGQAAFSAPDQLKVAPADGSDSGTIRGATVIAAPGSVPFFPPPLKPDGRLVLAPRFLSRLSALPPTMLVIGAGATGCESAFLFNALGVQVTWIVDQFGVLPNFHPDAGTFLAQALVRQGVHAVVGQQVVDLERREGQVTAVLADNARYSAAQAFVAIGRKPDWSMLNLEAAGVGADANGRYAVDGFGRTANPAVYLAGDADGGWMIANKAMSQGRIAAMHAAGLLTKPYDPDVIIQPVYSEPQVAQVGRVFPAPGLTAVHLPYSAALKPHLLAQGAGFLLLTYDEQSGLLRGGVAGGPEAAGILAPIALALKLGAHLSDLADLYAAHPTLSELPFLAAREAG